MSTPALVGAALAYAARGWRVLPLHSANDGACSCWRGAACRAAGKHPRLETGVEHAAAAVDLKVIREWWMRWPEANVGIVTGAASGLVVLDVDLAKGGTESLAALFPNGAPLTPRVNTGGGGLHLYFKHPGTPVPCRVNFRPGLDIRGDGGLVVAPPSRHKSEREYAFTDTGAV